MTENDTFICDMCTQDTPLADRVYVCTPRPSNPAEVVAIFWTCSKCIAPKPGTLSGTFSMLHDYIMSPEAEENGHLYLSI